MSYIGTEKDDRPMYDLNSGGMGHALDHVLLHLRQTDVLYTIYVCRCEHQLLLDSRNTEV